MRNALGPGVPNCAILTTLYFPWPTHSLTLSFSTFLSAFYQPLNNLLPKNNQLLFLWPINICQARSRPFRALRGCKIIWGQHEKQPSSDLPKKKNNQTNLMKKCHQVRPNILLFWQFRTFAGLSPEQSKRNDKALC